MQPIFSIGIIYTDAHLVEIAVLVSNGRYSGGTAIYVSSEELVELGRKILNFPKNLSDVVEEHFGEPESYSYLNFRFRCTDNLGHVGVEVTMYENWDNAISKETRSRLYVLLPVEPAGLDEFAKGLILMGETKQGSVDIKVV